MSKSHYQSEFRHRAYFLIRAPDGDSHGAKVMQRAVELLEHYRDMGRVNELIVQALLEKVEREMAGAHAALPARPMSEGVPVPRPAAAKVKSPVKAADESERTDHRRQRVERDELEVPEKETHVQAERVEAPAAVIEARGESPAPRRGGVLPDALFSFMDG